MRIAVAATPAVAIPTLNALLQSEHELIYVITRPDAPAGRGQAMQSSPVAQWGESNGVKVLKPDSTTSLGEVVMDLDLVITIGYGTLIPLSVLQIPRYGFINLHFSLLPRWRGAAPVQRAIEAGDGVTGVTVFALDAGMDTGPVYACAQIALDPDATSAQLFEVLAELGIAPVLETLELIASGQSPVAQSNEGATRAYKLSKDEGKISWSSSADEINRKINAFNPSPGAWSSFRGQVIKINRVISSSEKVPAGALLLANKSIYIGTSTQALELIEVTPAGKAAMPATSWANGARITSDDVML